MSKIIVGIDIGNATTETALARIENSQTTFLSSGIVATTGLKGTEDNISGVFESLKKALDKAGLELSQVSEIKINEAAPVIGDVAMETITQTIITESTIIGHNPNTPGGLGIGSGVTISLEDVLSATTSQDYIVIIDKSIDFEEAANIINQATNRGFSVKAAIVQKDDGVLINNRLNTKIPIVDEVTFVEKVPINMQAAVEVAAVGEVISQLSNPYGIASIFNLSPEETKYIVPIARALIGNRSAVVIKTPKGDVTERIIPAGHLQIQGENPLINFNVGIDKGAAEIMKAIEQASPLENVKGEPGTNAGGMLERVRQVMAELTNRVPSEIQIQDILAVDTFNPQKVVGALAGEFSMESAVGIAAMVKSDKLQMESLAKKIQEQLKTNVSVGGVEADMAILGALTTPGVDVPVAIIDMGAGSTDASILTGKEKSVASVHLAGAGNMVTLLIQTELGVSADLAEDIKKFPLAKVESVFHVRHEDGTVQFFEEALPPHVFARTVIVRKDAGELVGFVPIPVNISLEKIKKIRREAKTKVFVVNALRALRAVSPTGNIRDIDYVVLVGGSALDFEIPQLVTDELSRYGVVAGQGNIRATEGPRNAVATGLVLKS
ncbi:MAG: diol dehydratase reactivase subunit alpha [Defluviitaleaceae bacterium]|nr:diol dehydratase reactivase subunit alpha [Defluviitaleaceae bacterium]